MSTKWCCCQICQICPTCQLKRPMFWSRYILQTSNKYTTTRYYSANIFRTKNRLLNILNDGQIITMVWTLPTITNTQLSNVKIFNNGKPIDLVVDATIDTKKQDQDAFSFTPVAFFRNMATELLFLLKVMFGIKSNPEKSVYDLLIAKNRLIFIGFAIVLITTSIWIVLSIFFFKK